VSWKGKSTMVIQSSIGGPFVDGGGDKVGNENRGDDAERIRLLGITADRNERDLRRIKNSFSFQLGEHLVDSVKSPWKILLLPLTLPRLVIKKIIRKAEKGAFIEEGVVEEIGGQRNAALFFPTNGVGLGHFTRLLAIARRLREKDPETEIIFFTTMPALQILENQGFASYHLSSKYVFDDMGSKEWNIMCEEIMSLVLKIHNPKVFVFDGSYPYRGMLDAIKGRRNLKKLWVLRGNFKEGSKSLPKDSIEHFDKLIFPSDVSNSSGHLDEFGIDSMECGPIVMLDKEELLPRRALFDRLSIPKNATTAYIQLGAGKINDIKTDMGIILKELEKYEDVYAIIGESVLGEELEYDHPRIRVIREYPNSKYFESFDFAILAGGYNSYQEAVKFSLPTICLPNMKTGKDDQRARAKVAERAGCMIVIDQVNEESLSGVIKLMMDPENRKKMRVASEELIGENGADQVSEYISQCLRT